MQSKIKQKSQKQHEIKLKGLKKSLSQEFLKVPINQSNLNSSNAENAHCVQLHNEPCATSPVRSISNSSHRAERTVINTYINQSF